MTEPVAEQLYVIKWKSRIDSVVEEGSPLPLDSASSNARYANEESPEIDHWVDFYHHDRFGNKLSVGDRVKILIPDEYIATINSDEHLWISFTGFFNREGVVEILLERETLIKFKSGFKSDTHSVPFNFMEKIN
ncbi:MAG: hypothetical protein WBB28_02045 [Crinalium sp.]